MRACRDRGYPPKPSFGGRALGGHHNKVETAKAPGCAASCVSVAATRLCRQAARQLGQPGRNRHPRHVRRSPRILVRPHPAPTRSCELHICDSPTGIHLRHVPAAEPRGGRNARRGRTQYRRIPSWRGRSQGGYAHSIIVPEFVQTMPAGMEAAAVSQRESFRDCDPCISRGTCKATILQSGSGAA